MLLAYSHILAHAEVSQPARWPAGLTGRRAGAVGRAGGRPAGRPSVCSRGGDSRGGVQPQGLSPVIAVSLTHQTVALSQCHIGSPSSLTSVMTLQFSITKTIVFQFN